MAKKRKRRMGRPPKAPEDKQSYRVTVRLTPAEYKKLVGKAEKAGLSLSAYIAKHL